MSQKVDQRKGGLRCVGGEEGTGGEGRVLLVLLQNACTEG